MTTEPRPRKTPEPKAPAAKPPASKPPASKPGDVRHPYGPRPIAALLPGITRPAFKSAGSAAAQLMADWPVIVGPALAAQATPRRFAAGTLTLACTGPTALELQHLSVQLIERVNTHLGRAVVQRLRFVQGAVPFAPPARPRTPRRPILVEGLPPGPLRDALAALGAAIGHKPA